MKTKTNNDECLECGNAPGILVELECEIADYYDTFDVCKDCLKKALEMLDGKC